jgi:integrase
MARPSKPDPTMDEVVELPPGTYYYRRGLVLKVDAHKDSLEGRRWMWRYKSLVTGRTTETAVGSAYVLEPHEARQRVDRKWKELSSGIDPIDEKRKARARSKTFGQVVEAFIEAKTPGWSDFQKYNTNLLLNKHGAALLNVQMNAINADRIEAALKPLWADYPEQAKRTLRAWHRLFEYAANKEWFNGRNPCRWAGLHDDRFPDQSIEDVRHPAMPWREVPQFMKRLRGLESVKVTAPSAPALEFLILTWTRSNEVLGAQWSEINFQTSIWTIPTSRTKLRRGRNRRAIQIPLSTRALELLRSLPQRSSFVFTNDAGEPFYRKIMARLLRDEMKVPTTIHGFRSSAREWGDEQGFREDYLEKCLAHTFGNKTRQAYQRDDSVEGRREIMEAWAAYCDGPSNDNVVVLRKHA